jgi:predicted PurR-regulated permease PerM
VRAQRKPLEETEKEAPHGARKDAQIRRPRSRRTVPLRLVTLALLTAGLIALSVLVALPFLHAITWGLALAIMAWPIHRLVRERVKRPSVAASLSTLIVVLLIVVPGAFVVYKVGQEVEAIAAKSASPPEQMVSRDNLEQVPGGDRVVTWMDRVNVDIETQLQKAVSSLLPDPKGVAQNSIFAAVQFLVAILILFYVFRDRGEFLNGLRQLLPLTRSEADRVFASAADSVHATLYATVVTAIIDSTTGGVLFWFLGLPAPILWGAAMFVLSILPVVGIGLIWVPTAIYLAATGDWPSALAIITWGGLTAVFIDYILYARLAGDRMRMHPAAALVSFLGGLAVFGLSGMILGPSVVAMTAAMLDLWRERSSGEGSAMRDAA